MQEDIEHRAVTLAMNVSKMTGRTFRNALVKLLHFLKSKHQQHQQVAAPHQLVPPFYLPPQLLAVRVGGVLL